MICVVISSLLFSVIIITVMFSVIFSSVQAFIDVHFLSFEQRLI